MDHHRIVIALGGNALGNTLPEQMAAVKKTARTIVDLAAEGHEIIVTHGNGPQVGMINQAMIELSRVDENQPNTPLSVCVAMSQAYIGYDLQNAIREELKNRRIDDKAVVTMVTQVRVDPKDPAFDHPSKPIGRYMTQAQADEASRLYGHLFKPFKGKGYRRVVASPKPLEIVELDAIHSLSASGNIVIACGGGGIPVTLNGNHLKGASAVIDKDLVSSLLARQLDADILIILTAVEKAMLHFGQPDAIGLSDLTVSQAKAYCAAGEFGEGSMLPKILASMDFAASDPRRVALITLLEKAKDGIEGRTGTRIHL